VCHTIFKPCFALKQLVNAAFKSFDTFGALQLSVVVLRTLELKHQEERRHQQTMATVEDAARYAGHSSSVAVSERPCGKRDAYNAAL
jgi:hypothetical protein